MESFAERFWEKVDVGGPDECWPAHVAPLGRYAYAAAEDGRLEGAHRIAYRLVKGPIPDGLGVLHSCDNPPCCNPSHLRAGTQLENVREAIAKGRMKRKGEDHPLARLTAGAVRDIRLRCAGGESQREVAAVYGVSQSQVSLIVLRKKWTHVA